MIVNVIIFLLVFVYALNMGSGNYAASFASAYGSGIISRKKSQILFIIFVFWGAFVLGSRVCRTLGEKIISPELINSATIIIILFSASLCMFIANFFKVPQSTSLVAVGAISGVGIYHGDVYLKTFLYLVPLWILFPAIAYLITYFLGRLIYPSRHNNFWIYEKSVKRKNMLEMLVIVASCYNAFSIGANNVANAVAPLSGGRIIDASLGLLFAAPVFGMGSIVFPSVIKSAGKDIIPIGLVSANITCFVCATLMLIASYFGVPQSLVMIKVASITAIGAVKDGHSITLKNSILRKMYCTWIVMPVVAVLLSFFLSWITCALK